MAGAPAVQPIVTPEAVVLDFERAGVASRAIAFLIDVLALAVLVGVLLLLVFQLAGGELDGTAGALIAILTSLGVVVAWFCGLETLWHGRTLGKAAMGLRVVGADGTSERFQQAFLRAAVRLVDFFLIPIGFVAVVSALLSPRDQRLGDMAAGTLVVRERSAGADVAPAWFRPPYGWEGYAGSLDVTAIDDDEYTVVRNFLLRVPQLTARRPRAPGGAHRQPGGRADRAHPAVVRAPARLPRVRGRPVAAQARPEPLRRPALRGDRGPRVPAARLVCARAAGRVVRRSGPATAHAAAAAEPAPAPPGPVVPAPPGAPAAPPPPAPPGTAARPRPPTAGPTRGDRFRPVEPEAIGSGSGTVASSSRDRNPLPRHSGREASGGGAARL